MTKEQKVNVAKIILGVVAVAGLLSVAMVATNALQVLKMFDGNKRKYNPKYYFDKKTQDLVNKGFLNVVKEKGNNYVELTKKGEVELQKYLMKENVNKKQKWDGKWRVFTFDVWEKSRQKRDLLRKEIREFGFIQLQKSVWIYPYECRDFIELLKADLNFGKNVRYMIVENLDNDFILRKNFGLT